MISLRKLISLLFVMALALSSGATFAADKQYVLSVANSPETPQPAFVFTFDNTGNSSFNSLTLQLPAGWSISATGSATADRGVVSISSVNGGTRNLVTVNDINLPNGSGQQAFVTVTGVTGTSSCGGDTGTWTAQPWTGTPAGSGQKFNPKPGTISTSLPASCYTIAASAGSGGTIAPSGNVQVTAGANQGFTIAANTNYRILDVKVDGVSVGTPASYTFNAVSAPHTIAATFAANVLTVSLPQSGVIAGQTFKVKVALDGPIVPVTLASACFSGTGTLTPSGTDKFVEFSGQVANPSLCSVTATAANYPDAPKSFIVYSGTVGCDDSNNYVSNNGKVDPNKAYVDLDIVASMDYGVRRGPNLNTPVSFCQLVDVDLTFPDPFTAHFIYDKSSGQQGIFKYTVVWGEVSVDSAAVHSTDASGFSTQGWTTKRPRLAWVELMSGTPVYVPSLACVDDDLSLGDGLMPVLPSIEPFIGTPGTPSNANFYPGDPNAVAKAAQYLAGGGNKAKMCVAQHVWKSMQIVGGEIKVLYSSKIVDRADGWAAFDQ